MLYYKRHKRRFVVLKRILIIILALVITAVVYCETRISDFAPQYIRTAAEIRSQKVISQTVEQIIDEFNYSYDDIAVVKYAENGTVQAIETNSPKINLLKSAISDRVQEELGKIKDNELNIPLGVFTDITVLSNAGPDIKMTFSLTGSVQSELLSTFESAGINQSIHHIRLMLTTKLITTTPDFNEDITFATDYEIAQTVIIGSIPNYYGSLYKTY